MKGNVVVRGIEEGLEGREWGIWSNHVIYVYEILSLKGVSALYCIRVSVHFFVPEHKNLELPAGIH